MKKNYIVPAIKVEEVEMDYLLQNSGDNELNPNDPTTGLNDPPGYGGDSDGSHSVGVKPFSVWDE